ncbi:hypothetical protein [Sulfobacillus harzensis]|uniref:Uncharacterized protein n=1 Tax=Sulfobacillus harzensis TaxID=2729629 RepID=A0A7Y0L792_9FIRM|nr:hypothetical protein [Sulfobacillus harzensis]NMP24597.1 hypothetical protein [Sulfobacillus harzensis]
MTVDAILTEMRRRRQSIHTTRADIDRITEARRTGRWERVYRSRLYRIHSAEYCELLEVAARGVPG